MLRFIALRLLALIPLLLAVGLFSFILAQLAPGDFLSDLSLNPQISDETVKALRAQYGLDRPWHVQFVRWLASIVRGDFGYSFSYNRPVSALIGERVLNTALLAMAGLSLALIVAVPLGVISAGCRSDALDRIISLFSALSLSLPSIFLALLAVLFAAKTGWFPIGGVRSLDHDDLPALGKLLDLLRHLILPATVLAIRQMPGYLRQVRANMLDILSQDYIRTARAKGLAEREILFKHAFKNAVNPIISMFGSSIGSLLSGAFVVEVVMSWPGIGSLTVNALLGRDLYVLMACLIYAALLLALGNLLADLLLAAVDPRIRAQR